MLTYESRFNISLEEGIERVTICCRREEVLLMLESFRVGRVMGYGDNLGDFDTPRCSALVI